jgi:hypothetical protein
LTFELSALSLLLTFQPINASTHQRFYGINDLNVHNDSNDPNDSFMKIILVAGARPNFMKIAPIIRAVKSFNQTNEKNQINQRSPINETN